MGGVKEWFKEVTKEMKEGWQKVKTELKSIYSKENIKRLWKTGVREAKSKIADKKEAAKKLIEAGRRSYKNLRDFFSSNKQNTKHKETDNVDPEIAKKLQALRKARLKQHRKELEMKREAFRR